MQENTKSRLIIVWTFIMDVLITVASVKLAIQETGFEMKNGITDYHYIGAFCVVTIFFFVMFEMYTLKAENVYSALLSAGLSVVLCDVSVFFIDLILGWRCQKPLFWAATLFFQGAGIMVWRTFVAVLKKKVGPKRRMLIIENMKNTSRLARKLKYASNEENLSRYCMIDETNEEEVHNLIEDKLKDFDVIFVSPAISPKVSSMIVSRALIMQKKVNILADVYSVTTMKGRIYQIDDTPVIEKKGIYLTKMQSFVKRLFDVMVATAACVLTLPVFAVCAAAIKLDSKGPVIYKQERYTIHKKVFNCYKFRTMVADAEASGARFATENDPRITRVGKVLRQMRIDELPQIYNILLGQMSIVGPRPERPIFADEFSKNVANYDMRYSLKAGLTGYAQVYGRYNTRVSDKILMDMIYGTTYSFMLDIKIILLTIKVMFVKSATAGVDEELDAGLSSKEREEARRHETEIFMGGSNEEGNDNNTGV